MARLIDTLRFGGGVFVIDVFGYIGSGTRSEIEYAQETGKSARYLEEA